MSELINLGVNQGTILAYTPQLSEQSPEFKNLEKNIKSGRYGLFAPKGVSTQHLYVVLTQDCTIFSGKHIELVQLKKKNITDEGRVEHLLLGKDYSKLYLKFDNQFYEAEESLLTKIKNENLVTSITDGTLVVQDCLPDNDIRILLDWRMLAYLREPYPDKFNQLLSDYLGKEGDWFINFLKDNHNNIHSIRVYVSPDNIEDAEEYKFSLTALLSKEGEDVESEISNKLDEMLTQFNQCDFIDCIQAEGFDISSIDFPQNLVLSLTVTLDEFSFANAYVMREYNFQYLCY